MAKLAGDSRPKRVCLIHTGGTIGMHRTDQGYAPQPGVLKAALDALPDLHSDDVPHWDLIEFDPLLDSSNIAVNEWVKLARTIAEHYRNYDGFVVLHGTDTMAYTASALSFMLDGLAKPVIITGSQIPLCEIRNDARDNVITALMIAIDEATPPEVSLYFGGMLYRGNRATKVSSDELIAFDSPNAPPLAQAGVHIEFQRAWLYQKRHPSSGLSVSPFSVQKIAVLKIFPGIQFDVFSSMLDDQLGGLVLEAFGAGNIPESEALRRFLEKAEAKGTVIVVCTQCLRGAATIGQYETSSMLAKAGAISGYDLTVEAAVTKLYYLLSLELDRAAVKQLMQTNLRGEITLPD